MLVLFDDRAGDRQAAFADDDIGAAIGSQVEAVQPFLNDRELALRRSHRHRAIERRGFDDGRAARQRNAELVDVRVVEHEAAVFGEPQIAARRQQNFRASRRAGLHGVAIAQLVARRQARPIRLIALVTHIAFDDVEHADLGRNGVHICFVCRQLLAILAKRQAGK